MRYGSLTLRSSGGLNESFMFSNAEAGPDFSAAAEELKRLLSSGKGGRELNYQSRLGQSR